MQTSHKLYQCKLKGSGFIASSQPGKSIYFGFVDDRTKAKTYKTKQLAARALNYKSYDSAQAKEDLEFFEIVVTYNYI